MIYRDLNKKIRRVLKEDIEKYGSLIEIYREGREIPRYILFRNALIKYDVDLIDVKNVKSLFILDQQTLGSYLAQRPLITYIASTLTAVLVASATKWSSWFVGVFFLFGLLMIYGIYTFPVFPGRQRRQYELNRWLAWYEADAPNLMPANSDDAKPPVD